MTIGSIYARISSISFNDIIVCCLSNKLIHTALNSYKDIVSLISLSITCFLWNANGRDSTNTCLSLIYPQKWHILAIYEWSSLQTSVSYIELALSSTNWGYLVILGFAVLKYN